MARAVTVSVTTWTGGQPWSLVCSHLNMTITSAQNISDNSEHKTVVGNHPAKVSIRSISSLSQNALRCPWVEIQVLVLPVKSEICFQITTSRSEDPGNACPADHNSYQTCRWETPRSPGNIYLWLFAEDRGGGDREIRWQMANIRLSTGACITCYEVPGHIAATVPG